MSNYFDYASTAPLSNSVIASLDTLSQIWQNPNSVYTLGRYNKEVIENVRCKVADNLHCNADEIIFTSSGSESNSLAIDGFLKGNKGVKVVCSSIEHASIYDNPNISEYIPVDSFGIVDYEYISNMELNNVLVSIMMCNNEVGCYEPIKDIVDLVHKKGGYVHCDCVQAFGHVDIDLHYLNVDMASFSGHKIGSIRGVGFLYVKNGINIAPIIYGKQENSIRGGTYNDLAIKTLGLAIDDIDLKKETVIKSRQLYFISKLLDIDGIKLNGPRDNRNANNINICISGLSIDGQQIVSLLDTYGFQISAGSACNSYSTSPSHVLKAIGLSDEDAKNSIRISVGIDNSVQDINNLLDTIELIVKMNKKISE